MRSKILFLIFIFSSILYSGQYPSIDDDLSKMESMLEDLENDNKTSEDSNKASVLKKDKGTVRENKIIKKNNVNTFKPRYWGAFGTETMGTIEDIPSEGAVYYYGYVPEIENHSGTPGNFIFSLSGEIIAFKETRIKKSGFAIDLGYQYNWTGISLFFALNIGYRAIAGGDGHILPIGLNTGPRFRLLKWMSVFLNTGLEFISIQPSGNFDYVYTVYGIGLMLRTGIIDKKTEFNLYKEYGISRTMLIIAFNVTKAPSKIVNIPGSKIFKIGFSFEI